MNLILNVRSCWGCSSQSTGWVGWWVTDVKIRFLCRRLSVLPQDKLYILSSYLQKSVYGVYTEHWTPNTLSYHAVPCWNLLYRLCLQESKILCSCQMIVRAGGAENPAAEKGGGDSRLQGSCHQGWRQGEIFKIRQILWSWRSVHRAHI